MKLKKYKDICNHSDDILGLNSSYRRVSIDSLHIWSEHPESLLKIKRILNKQFFVSLENLKNILSRYKALLLAFLSIGGRSETYKKVDVVIISNLLNKTSLGEEDFYFGSLPEELERLGISCNVVLRDQTGMSKSLKHNAIKVWKSDMANRFFLSNRLNVLDEFLLQRGQKKEGLLLHVSDDKIKLQNKISKYTSIQSLSRQTLHNVRFYKNLIKLFIEARPKVVIVTYEGYAWERLAFSAARYINPNSYCIGYQHTILFENQHAVKRPLGSKYDPNLILTSGKITQSILSNDPRLVDIEIKSIGVCRNQYDSTNEVNTKGRSCLVIPDGTYSECLEMIRYSFNLALKAKDIHFIIRMHPLLEFEDLINYNSELKNIPKNFEVSSLSINSDFERCRWALYRGSGAAIRAVSAGLRPFYVDFFEEMTIDPLYQLSEWRRVINNTDDFILQINSDLGSNAEKLNKEWQNAKYYCDSYFKKVDYDRFCNIISNAYCNNEELK